MSHPRLACARPLIVAMACILGSAAIAAAEQPPSPSPARLSAAEQRLHDVVLARYRALSVQNGIVLVPLSRIAEVDSVELRGGTIAINGRLVTGAEVRERLGHDADAILELSYLDLSAQQRTLLPMAGRPEAAATGRPTGAPPPLPETVEPPLPLVPDRMFRREVDARVRVFGDITVEEDEQVNGAVVAVGGSVKVDGRVRDNVVAVGGNVRLGPHADVRGDVTVVGGTIERDPGATVSGRLNEVAFSVPAVRIRPGWNVRWAPWFDGGPWRAFRLFGTLVRMALFALLATIVLLAAPRAVRRVEFAVTSQPWKSALVGLLAQLVFVPVVVLVVVVLAISIIGIPLLVLVPFGVLAFFVALVLGFTGAACALARLFEHRPSAAELGVFSALAAGLAMIWGLTLLGRIVGLGGGPLALIAVVLIFVGFLIEYAAWTLGLGGALITRFGRHGALPPEAPVELPSEAGSIESAAPSAPAV